MIPIQEAPKVRVIHLDRQSNAHEAYSEYAGLSGMPEVDRAHFEQSSGTLRVAVAPGSEIAVPKVIVPEK